MTTEFVGFIFKNARHFTNELGIKTHITGFKGFDSIYPENVNQDLIIRSQNAQKLVDILMKI